MSILALNQSWKLHDTPLGWNESFLSQVLALQDGWMDCDLPCDIHMPLMENDRIKDPVLADYSFDSEWTANRAWWFVRHFDIQKESFSAGPVELHIESIDGTCDVFLNGVKIGKHMNAFRPFICDLKEKLLEGSNTLCIRVTTGLESVTDQQLSEIDWHVCHEKNNGCPERGDLRRTFIRRPQYSVGWDWGPKAITCGIVRDAHIEFHGDIAVRNVGVEILEASSTARIKIQTEIERFDCFRSIDADLHITVSYGAKECACVSLQDLLLTSGTNYIDTEIAIPDAKLWWPAGYGEQPIYTVSVAVDCNKKTYTFPEQLFGIRTVRLDTTRINNDKRNFTFVVNNVPVFCKGGNWIPSDSIYARIPEKKYEALIQEAVNANFNMLRVWGGGFYEIDYFYSLCDQYGIMVWQDFMLACGAFPDHHQWFRDEIALESDYQTKRLRNHPCICLWCGNNEMHSALYANKVQDRAPYKSLGTYVSNYTIREVVHKNCPNIPYWVSSPYGGDDPDSEAVGDVHYWGQCTMNPNMEKRISPTEYDNVQSPFVSEYGYVGPCSIKTIEQYFDVHSIDTQSRIWNLHNNTFEKNTVIAGIQKHYLENCSNLSLDGYLLYAGMVQSLMLGYSLEALRFKKHCSGGLFWMYNDTWGEVGWTIVDYYLRRKISYYGVKRAFANQKLIIRQNNGEVQIMGCNDLDTDLFFDATVGIFGFDGTQVSSEHITVDIPARSRQVVYQAAMPRFDPTKEIFAIYPASNLVAPERLYANEFQKMSYNKKIPSVIDTSMCGHSLSVTIQSDCFVHGVYFEGAEKYSDNYFELLPNQSKSITIDVLDEPITLNVLGLEATFTIDI